MLSIDDFVQDAPTTDSIRPTNATIDVDLIDGVILCSLASGSDARGTLYELMTEREPLASPIVHVYQVECAPGSIRAWQIHKHQLDRLTFTNGNFRVVLYDLRPDSPTCGKLNVLEVGAAWKCLLQIPAFVAHAVQNYGQSPAWFTNLPTKVYDPANPDKWRVPLDHPGIPYRFQ